MEWVAVGIIWWIEINLMVTLSNYTNGKILGSDEYLNTFNELDFSEFWCSGNWNSLLYPLVKSSNVNFLYCWKFFSGRIKQQILIYFLQLL